MKKFEIDVNSWHYEIINRYSSHNQWTIDNLCQYIRAFIFALIFAIIIYSIAGVVVGGPVMDTFTWLFWMIAHWQYVEPSYGPQAIGITFTTIGTLIAVWFACVKIHEKYTEAIEKDQPNIVVAAYKSWKDKYCGFVEFVGNEDAE